MQKEKSGRVHFAGYQPGVCREQPCRYRGGALQSWRNAIIGSTRIAVRAGI